MAKRSRLWTCSHPGSARSSAAARERSGSRCWMRAWRSAASTGNTTAGTETCAGMERCRTRASASASSAPLRTLLACPMCATRFRFRGHRGTQDFEADGLSIGAATISTIDQLVVPARPELGSLWHGSVRCEVSGPIRSLTATTSAIRHIHVLVSNRTIEYLNTQLKIALQGRGRQQSDRLLAYHERTRQIASGPKVVTSIMSDGA